MIKSSATTDSHPGVTPAPPVALPASQSVGIGPGILVALVVGPVIGSVGLMQNEVVRWCAVAILIGWTVTGIGALMLAVVYRKPPLAKPEAEPGQGVCA